MNWSHQRHALQALQRFDESGLKDFAADRVAGQLKKTNLSPVVTELLTGITKQGQHQKLLDEVVGALHKFLNNDDAVEAIRKRVSEELPSVLIVFRADEAILKRILKTASFFHSKFKRYIRKTRVRILIKTADGKRARLFDFNKGRFSSPPGNHDPFDAALVFKDAETGFSVLTSKKKNASFKAAADGELVVRGMSVYAQWFEGAVKLVL